MANNRYRREILIEKLSEDHTMIGQLKPERRALIVRISNGLSIRRMNGPWVAPTTLQSKQLRKQSGQQNFQLQIFMNSACFFQGGE
jgi:hypothetical protein